MKIHIIGCSGTGKTRLATALARTYGIPHHDLDDLQWDREAGTYGVRTAPEKRAALLEEILQQPDWIVEGVYYSWVSSCFADADRIYLLDLPPRIYKTRILKRFLRRKLGLEKGKKETFRSLLALLKWTDKFRQENMPQIRQILGQYPKKVTVLTGTKEIDAFLRRNLS